MAATTSAQQIILHTGDDSLPPEFWDLIERYRSELMNQAHSILGSLEDAEDVVQETFCEAFRNNRQLSNVRSIGAWLRSVNRFNSLSKLRSRRRDSRRIELKNKEFPSRTHTTGGFSALEMHESVTKAIETLPQNLRSIVTLRYWERMSYEAIAIQLNIPIGTVGTRLYDATVLLYDKLKITVQLGELK